MLDKGGKQIVKKNIVYLKDGNILYDAEEDCKHEIKPQWSGVKCIKCGGWFCY